MFSAAFSEVLRFLLVRTRTSFITLGYCPMSCHGPSCLTLAKHCEGLQDKLCDTTGKTNDLTKCIACMKEIIARYILVVNINV